MPPASRKAPLSELAARFFPEDDPKELYAAILCGEITVNGERARNPKARFPLDARIERLRKTYVGRGGVKLEGALRDFAVDPSGLVWLDAGASTGGFTDCLLQHGASRVHAVDVGYNQLDWKLRSDPRVIVHERTNIMDLDRRRLEPPPAAAVADLSFRSLRGAASRLLDLTAGGLVIALVKPQFENPSEEDFDGVVRTRAARFAVLRSLRDELPREGVHVVDAAPSAIRGRRGNAEFFLRLAAEPGDDAYVERRLTAALD